MILFLFLILEFGSKDKVSESNGADCLFLFTFGLLLILLTEEFSFFPVVFKFSSPEE